LCLNAHISTLTKCGVINYNFKEARLAGKQEVLLSGGKSGQAVAGQAARPAAASKGNRVPVRKKPVFTLRTGWAAMIDRDYWLDIDAIEQAEADTRERDERRARENDELYKKEDL
jgi:hypothetical protein